MTTIEDKVRLFSKIIYDRIKEEKQVELDSFEAERERRLKELQKELEEIRNEELQEAAKKARIKAIERLSKEKIKFQQRELILREEMIKEVTERIKDKVISYTSTIDYEATLMSGIKSTLDKLDKGQYSLYLISNDIDKVQEDITEYSKGQNLRIDIKEADKNILGGFILEDFGKKFRIDNSLRNRLHDLKEYIGLEINRSLK